MHRFRRLSILAATLGATALLTSSVVAATANAKPGRRNPASNPAGNIAFIVNTNELEGNDAAQASVTLVNRTTSKVIRTVTVNDGNGHHELGHLLNVSNDGTKLWLQARHDGSVGQTNVYDLRAFLRPGVTSVSALPTAPAVERTFNVGNGVQNTKTPNGRFVFLSADQGSAGINVFDTSNDGFIGNIPNDNTAPHAGAVSPDGKTYYTTTAQKHHIVGYDISTLPKTAPAKLKRVLDIDVGYGSLHAVAIDPTGRYLFVGNANWSIPQGATARSGVNVVDLKTRTIIATVAGRPHNFAISPDGRYLASTELKADVKADDCDAGSGDLGDRLQIIDISTLASHRRHGRPDVSKIKDIYHFDTPGLGGSHAKWDERTGRLYYSTYDNTTSQGWLYVLNTSGLAGPHPSISQELAKQKIGWAPHGIAFEEDSAS